MSVANISFLDPPKFSHWDGVEVFSVIENILKL